jgi:hypothetical protein
VALRELGAGQGEAHEAEENLEDPRCGQRDAVGPRMIPYGIHESTHSATPTRSFTSSS